VRRALAALSVGAFLTLVVDTAGSGGSWWAVGLGAFYLLAATVGFHYVWRYAHRWPAYLYIWSLLLHGYAVFVAASTVGATLLLVVLVSQSVLLLPLRGAVPVIAVVPFFHVGMSPRDGLREGLGLLAAAAFTAVVTKLLVREQRARSELAEAHARLREYAVQAETLAAAQERNRVARDIHDGLGHSLTVVQMQIKAARAVLGDAERADAVLAKAQNQAEEALREVRRSVGALRVPAAPVPLPEALKTLAEEASAAGVPTGLDVTGTVRALPEEAHESLYRAAQEGLTNVRRHARATRADLTLDYTRPDLVVLTVRDDGVGVGDGGGGGTGFGLLGIRERAAHAGGRMALEPLPGKGTQLSVEVPG
jgi:signal transduction histidine kinase